MEGISGGWLSELGRRIKGFEKGGGREGEGGCLETCISTLSLGE